MRNVKINLYEVGDIFLTVNNINPGTRFGGTWELIAKGRTLVGVDPNDSDFDVVEKTGGSKYMQIHNHYSMQIDGNKVAWGGSGNELNFSSIGVPWTGNFNQGSKIVTSEAGTGNSGNLQPYFTCYIWCRTA